MWPVFSFRRPGLTIHAPPANVSIQRSGTSRDTTTRITLPSHPAIGAQKPQPSHTMTQVSASLWPPATETYSAATETNNLNFFSPQKPIFSPVTPVAAATVAPIVATNTVPSTTTIGTGFLCIYIYTLVTSVSKQQQIWPRY